jgi:hypothetical protein
MTDHTDSAPRFNRDLLFYASRGFVQSLNASQREVFLSLFQGDGTTFAIETSLEQARFELAVDEIPNPDAPVLAALSYALPRMTTAGWTVAMEIERVWPTLSDTTRKLVREKIHKAIEAGRSGASCDTAHWRRVANLPVNEAERIERMSF